MLDYQLYAVQLALKVILSLSIYIYDFLMASLADIVVEFAQLDNHLLKHFFRFFCNILMHPNCLLKCLLESRTYNRERF